MNGLTKIRAGLYRHDATGRLIVQTDGWEGPRGGNRRYWEHATDEGDNTVIDGSDLFKSLRTAAAALGDQDAPSSGA